MTRISKSSLDKEGYLLNLAFLSTSRSVKKDHGCSEDAKRNKLFSTHGETKGQREEVDDLSNKKGTTNFYSKDALSIGRMLRKSSKMVVSDEDGKMRKPVIIHHAFKTSYAETN